MTKEHAYAFETGYQMGIEQATSDDKRLPIVTIVVQGAYGIPEAVIIGRADSLELAIDDTVIMADFDDVEHLRGPGATYAIHFPHGAFVARGEDL